MCRRKSVLKKLIKTVGFAADLNYVSIMNKNNVLVSPANKTHVSKYELLTVRVMKIMDLRIQHPVATSLEVRVLFSMCVVTIQSFNISNLARHKSNSRTSLN